jgi:hypothetical protein
MAFVRVTFNSFTGLIATAVGTKAFFVGGNGPHPTEDVVDIYDAITDRWSSTQLPSPQGDAAATSVGTKAIFAGGAADVYDTSTGQWSTTTLSEGRTEMAATTVGTKAIFAGV